MYISVPPGNTKYLFAINNQYISASNCIHINNEYLSASNCIHINNGLAQFEDTNASEVVFALWVCFPTSGCKLGCHSCTSSTA